MLSKRLKTIASLITTDSVIDVGCDHGYLDIYLTLKKIKCLATDISPNALSSAINNFKKYDLDIDCMCTSGLDGIDIKDSDTIVISGMGTDTIINILSKNISNDLVISSNNHIEKLRRCVVGMGYYISREVFVVDKDKEYIIIKFKKGYVKYTDYDYIIGPKIKDTAYFDYLKNKYSRILNSIPSKYKDEINYYKRLIREINKRKKSKTTFCIEKHKNM